jgi:hypothetical protein
MNKALVLGDVHGEATWKSCGDIQSLIDDTENVLTPEYDKYIFLGDYVDSFWVDDSDMVDNLEEIIAFRDKYSERVILLLGDHDLQYYYGHDKMAPSKNIREGILTELQEIYVNNIAKFSITANLADIVFSHSGVQDEWFEQLSEDKNLTASQVVDIINNAWNNSNLKPLFFQTGTIFGGSNTIASIFYSNKLTIFKEKYESINQVVGHHTYPDNRLVQSSRGWMLFCDILQHQDKDPYKPGRVIYGEVINY